MTWRELAAARKLAEAAELLRPKLSGTVGMGYYAAEGHELETLGDAATAVVEKRKHWEAALESYLLYSLVPARGDSEYYGRGLAEAVLKKIEAL